MAAASVSASSRPAPDRVVDTSGLVCPLPIIKASEAMAQVAPGGVLHVIATDFGILDDLPAWCTSMRYELLALDTVEDGGAAVYHGFVRRGR